MMLYISRSWMLAGLLAAATALVAQQQPSQTQQKPAAQQPAGSSGNPFPEDTSNVPLMPNGNSAGVPAPAPGNAAAPAAMPARDTDPARSPDEPDAAEAPASGAESSSSVADVDKFAPKDDENERRKLAKEAPEYHETASNDIDVGKYELDRHEWRAAQSRFQSAMIMDPQNPEVYWGLAESARHLGDYASARTYYQKVIEYDPDSRHSKDAEKALKEPEIANAQTASSPGKK
jgi:tetratricopeptide (TPR) repeat protein